MRRQSKSWSKWTPELIADFKIDYPFLSWDELIEKYSCPKSSLLSKASELGIKRLVGKVVKYTAEDDEVILECFNNGMSDEDIGNVLNRSASSIRTRRQRLGFLVRPGEWTEREEDILRQNYSIMPASEVSMLLPGRSRNAVVTHAIQLGLSGYRSYHEYTTEEELFIKDNYLHMSDLEIGERLGHSRESIKNRRNRLGLHRPKERSKYNDASEYFRKYNNDWKAASIKSCGFKCHVTGKRFDDIHHLMSLNKIIADACISAGIDIDNFDPNYADEYEKSAFINAVRAEQSKYPLGVCLAKDVHIQFHNIYGYGNNTPEQFYEFINTYYPSIVN